MRRRKPGARPSANCDTQTKRYRILPHLTTEFLVSFFGIFCLFSRLLRGTTSLQIIRDIPERFRTGGLIPSSFKFSHLVIPFLFLT